MRCTKNEGKGNKTKHHFSKNIYEDKDVPYELSNSIN